MCVGIAAAYKTGLPAELPPTLLHSMYTLGRVGGRNSCSSKEAASECMQLPAPMFTTARAHDTANADGDSDGVVSEMAGDVSVGIVA